MCVWCEVGNKEQKMPSNKGIELELLPSIWKNEIGRWAKIVPYLAEFWFGNKIIDRIQESKTLFGCHFSFSRSRSKVWIEGCAHVHCQSDDAVREHDGTKSLCKMHYLEDGFDDDRYIIITCKLLFTHSPIFCTRCPKAYFKLPDWFDDWDNIPNEKDDDPHDVKAVKVMYLPLSPFIFLPSLSL